MLVHMRAKTKANYGQTKAVKSSSLYTEHLIAHDKTILTRTFLVPYLRAAFINVFRSQDVQTLLSGASSSLPPHKRHIDLSPNLLNTSSKLILVVCFYRQYI